MKSEQLKHLLDIPITVNGFEPDGDEFAYTSRYFQIIANCLQGDVGINFIAKTYKKFPLKTLFPILSDRVIMETDYLKTDGGKGSTLLEHIEKAKIAIVDIILLYCAHTSQAFDELNDPQVSGVRLSQQ